MPKQSPLKWPLPTNVHPARTRCYQIEVPDDRGYIGAFLGAMFLLSKPYAWGDDPAHTALEVGKVWRAIFDSLLAGNCKIPARLGSAGAESDDNMIRQNPDNPCELQTSIDGVNWCTFADLSLCQASPPQPGNGSPQPTPGGGCVTYHGTMGAKEPWYIPTVVSDGDTVEIVSTVGSWTGGDFSRWYCGDGERFFAGACIGLQATDAGDPLPTAPHMSMILLVDGVYYDLSSGPVTISGGATNQQALIYPNDSDLTDNAGTLTFDVKVCNNQAGAWTSILDFTLNPYADFIAAPFVDWTLGVGFTGGVNGGVANWAQLDLTLDSFDLDSLVMEYHMDSIGGTSTSVFYLANGGSYGTPGTPVAGGTQIYSVLDPVTGITTVTVVASSGTTGGPDKITKLTISGHGPKPSQLP